jgi:hypothetical protein
MSTLTGFSTTVKAVDAVLVASEAHLRLVEACTQHLLGNYSRLVIDTK